MSLDADDSNDAHGTDEASFIPADGSAGWTLQDKKLLARAIAKYPRGTPDRWQAVTDFLNQNSGSPPRRLDDVVAVAKQSSRQKPEVNPFDQFLQQRKPVAVIESPLSARMGAEPTIALPLSAQGLPPSATPAVQSESEAEWTEAEKLALIRAYRNYPKDHAGRFDLIALAVGGGKSKVACQEQIAKILSSVKSKRQAAGPASNSGNVHDSEEASGSNVDS
eukprot:jgi/Mesvir1/10269/Mv07820-RA.1